jgi:phage-related minor tail protein
MSDALVGIITRTKSWKQVGMDLFMSLTRAAANYIVKLVMIKAFSGVMGGGGLGGGAGLLGGLFGAANGAAFPGGVRMFANGGIIGGPTLFGMAGEAGPEAIMPLKNVGGKLGVAANGGGGNMTINIQAIDTQTGVMFLMKNLDTIQAGLQHRNKLNTGARQIP